MSNDLLGNFINKKKAESPFLTLADKESIIVVRLKDMKTVTKAGYGGEEKEVLRLTCEVDTSEGIREKIFDNGTKRFAEELQNNAIAIGDKFTLTRNGEMTKTRYTISNVGKTQMPEEMV